MTPDVVPSRSVKTKNDTISFVVSDILAPPTSPSHFPAVEEAFIQ